jgi:RHH-type proline utilization regulon transcriptional repressor/proline dehydrogenase/delta 1-pyrroline-5-carboxylate dehydrogenase
MSFKERGMISERRLEERTKEIGRELYASMSGEIPSFFDRKRWSGRLMEWVMRDDNFRVRLFRFIDVLPALRRDDHVVRLLKEYFSAEEDIPPIIRRGIRRISEGRVMPFVAGRVVRAAVGSLARQFIAGSNPEDSLRSLEALGREGADLSVDLLGEVVTSDKEAEVCTRRYLELLGACREGGKIPRLLGDAFSGSGFLDVSLKVSSFYSQLDPLNWEGSIGHAKEGLRPILSMARDTGASVTFDMEHHYFKDLIIAVFKDIFDEFHDGPHAGIAIQAYLEDSLNDLTDLIEWAEKRERRRITVRLVKGAYWDYELAVNRQKGWPVPVFLDKEDTDCNYEDLAKLLLQNTRSVRPAFATHNMRSISFAIAVAESLNVSRQAFEFQMLYGMAEPLRRGLLKMGYPVRVYTPVGEFLPGMAYLIRRLLENTSNASFLRKSFVEKTPFEELIKAPQPVHLETVVRNDMFANEPALDFSVASNREGMREALQKTKMEFGKRYGLVIGNREIHKEGEIVSLNPSMPEEIVGKVSSGEKCDADEAVSEARKTWVDWRKVPVKERADYLFRAAQKMRSRRFELAAWEVNEVGKTWKDADGDVTEAIDYLEYYGREMIRIGQSRNMGDYPGEENEYCYVPRGTGVVISPWNFPLAIPAGMVSAAVVTGNCAILKPSGRSPVTGRMLVDIFRSAGLPGGVLQYLPGPGEEVGEHLAAHPDIDFIAFTGSSDVGLKILEIANRPVPGQKKIKRVVAEMGGKNAVIVDETADLDEAVKGVLESAFGYQGQKCSACSRVIVMEDIFEDFSGRFKDAVESVKIGPAADPAVFAGPVIDGVAAERIKRYQEMGSREGNTVFLRPGGRNGYFVGPAAFRDLNQDSPVLREEIFGPVLAILRAKDIDEALEIANESVYALTGGLYSRSPENIRKAKEEFLVGNLYVNRKITGALVGRQPFGGFGMSGTGSKAGGPDYLLQFMNPRCVSENTLRKGFAPETR